MRFAFDWVIQQPVSVIDTGTKIIQDNTTFVYLFIIMCLAIGVFIYANRQKKGWQHQPVIKITPHAMNNVAQIEGKSATPTIDHLAQGSAPSLPDKPVEQGRDETGQTPSAVPAEIVSPPQEPAPQQEDYPEKMCRQCNKPFKGKGQFCSPTCLRLFRLFNLKRKKDGQ